VRLNNLAKKYEGSAHFLCVYIKEAHPTDGVQSAANLDDDILYTQPTTEDERAEIAGVCMLRYNFSFPMLLDNMTDEANDHYNALPERLYVLDPDGTIAYKGGMGPHCFDVDEFEEAIMAAIARPAAAE
jgi:type I thyroxine 5'-deiodinase